MKDTSLRRLAFWNLANLTLWALAVTGLPVVSASSAAAASDANRTVLITGANRGIGLEFARQYRAAGWNVIATAREPAAATELKALGVRVEALDVTAPASVEGLATRLRGQPIDLLINNAGVSGGGRRLADLKAEDYRRVLEVNAVGPMRVTQALLPNLRAGQGKTVVGLSSALASIAQNTGGGNYGYRESKTALNMFVRTLAAELRSEGFTCIVISPGWVQTDMGGSNAPLTPAQSIAGMKKVIDGLRPDDTGKFWNYDGTTLPW